MPVMIQCPSCKWKGRAPDEALGRKVRCPSCKSEFTAAAPPSEAAPPADDLEVVEEQPAAAAKEGTTKKAAESNHEEEEDITDRPRKKSRGRDEEDDEDDDRPRKKRRYHDEEADEDDDRPTKKRRDGDDEDDEDEDRPKKKRRDREDDEDDEDDRPKKRRDRDDEDDEDDDRPRKKRRSRDDEDEPKKLSKKDRQKQEIKRLRLAVLLNFIGAALMIGTFGLCVLLEVIGWAADWREGHGIWALASVVAAGSWIVSGVGFGFGLAGPKSNNAFGLSIATLSVAGADLLLGIMSLAFGYGDLTMWDALATNFKVITIMPLAFHGSMIVPLLAFLTEPARLILYALTLKAFAEGLRKYDTVNRAKPLVIGAGAVYGGVIVVNLIFGIIAKSMFESKSATMSTFKTINVMGHLDMILSYAALTGLAVWFFFAVKEGKDDF